jgi:hypothetical protein
VHRRSNNRPHTPATPHGRSSAEVKGPWATGRLLSWVHAASILSTALEIASHTDHKPLFPLHRLTPGLLSQSTLARLNAQVSPCVPVDSQRLLGLFRRPSLVQASFSHFRCAFIVLALPRKRGQCITAIDANGTLALALLLSHLRTAAALIDPMHAIRGTEGCCKLLKLILRRGALSRRLAALQYVDTCMLKRFRPDKARDRATP